MDMSCHVMSTPAVWKDGLPGAQGFNGALHSAGCMFDAASIIGLAVVGPLIWEYQDRMPNVPYFCHTITPRMGVAIVAATWSVSVFTFALTVGVESSLPNSQVSKRDVGSGLYCVYQRVASYLSWVQLFWTHIVLYCAYQGWLLSSQLRVDYFPTEDCAHGPYKHLLTATPKYLAD